MNIKLTLPDLNAVDLEIPGELSEDYIIKSLLDFGNWEPSLTKKVNLIFENAALRKDKNYIFLDIGSCFGYYSIISSAKGIPSIAYEPNPKTAAIIKNHIEKNNTLIELREYALGKEEGEVFLTSPHGNIGATQISAESENLKPIPIKRLDDENIKNNVILIKIDVEGKEGDVILGGIDFLETIQPEFLLVEVSPIYTPIETIIDTVFVPLWKLNYLSFDVGVQETGPLQETSDVFKYINTLDSLRNFFKNKDQTNFLFIKQSNTGIKMLTGDDWKDELIMHWNQEYSSNLNDKLYLSNYYLNEVSEKLKNASNSVNREEVSERAKLFQELQDKYDQTSNLIVEKFKISENALVDKFKEFAQNALPDLNQQLSEKIVSSENKIQEHNLAKYSRLESLITETHSQYAVLNSIQEKLEQVLLIEQKFNSAIEEKDKQIQLLGNNINSLNSISALLEQNKEKMLSLEQRFLIEIEEKNKQIQTLSGTATSLNQISSSLEQNKERMISFEQRFNIEIEEKNKQIQTLGNTTILLNTISALLEQSKNTLVSFENKFDLEINEKNNQINMLINRNVSLEDRYTSELDNERNKLRKIEEENDELRSYLEQYKNMSVFQAFKHKVFKGPVK